jgi:hypothetical protein
MAIKKKMFFGIVSLVVLLFLAAGCKEDLPAGPGLNPVGVLLSSIGCKDFGGSKAGTGTFSSTDSSYECLEYEYDGRTLRFTHVNAAFNCCLDRITSIVRIEGNTISLEEESILENGGCFCECLYDLVYQITNLAPAVYTFEIPSFSGVIVVDLRNPTSNRYCEERNRYPWN